MNQNKLTLEEIESLIIKRESFHAGQKTTVVVLTLKNGFEVVGTSSCVDPKEYNHSLGVSYATARAMDTIWQVEGYALQQRIYAKKEKDSSEAVNPSWD